MRNASPFAALVACMLAISSGLTTSRADVIERIEGEPIGGRLTLDEGSKQATVTDAAGKTQSVGLVDIDEVRFGEELVVVRGGNLLLINNDHKQGMARKSKSIKLRAGLHRIVIPYWQGEAQYGLTVRVSGPGLSGEVELDSDTMRCFRDSEDKAEPSPGIDPEGYRLPELGLDEAEDRRRMLSRAQYRYYVGDESIPFSDMSVLRRLKLKRSGTTSSIDTGLVIEPNQHIGLVFEAFFIAKNDGEYNFSLNSDDGSQLYFGEVKQFQAGQLDNSAAGPTPWRTALKPDGLAFGELVSLGESSLTMKLSLGDEQPAEVALALPAIAAIWDTRLDPEQFDRDNEPADLDTAYIRDKDNPEELRSVSGKVVGLNDESLVFSFRGQERKIDRGRLAGLVFAHAERPAPSNPGFYQTIRLRTGQVLPCRVSSIGEDRVAFDLLAGGRAEAPRAALIAMRFENGRRVDLTRVPPTAEEAVPYFSLAIPHRVNENFTGEPIRLYDEKTYERGLAVHSKSRLHYKLDRPCKMFRASFGLMDPGGKLGDVTARVIGDGEVLWEQAGITAKTGVVGVEVKLDGVKRLVLEVDFGEGQGVGDRAAWCNPELIFAIDP